MQPATGRPDRPTTTRRGRYRLSSGDVVATTEVEEADVEAMRRWLGDPRFVAMSGGPVRRHTAAQIRTLLGRNDGLVNHHMAIRTASTGRPIGYARATVDPVNLLCAFTPVVAADAPASAADHAVRALCDWSFGVLGVEKAVVRIAATNLPVLAALEAAPAVYRREARLVDSVRLLDGSRTDQIRHGVLAREWADARTTVPEHRNGKASAPPELGPPVQFPDAQLRPEALGRATIPAGPYSLEIPDAADNELLAAWAADPRLMPALGNRPTRRGRDEIETFVRSFDGRSGHLRMIRAGEERLTVGYCSARIDLANSDAEVTLAVADPRAPRRPIMRLVLRHLVDALFDKVRVERVSAEVMATNRVISDFLAGSIGFEGRLAEEIRRPDGTRADVLRYGLSRRDWAALRERGIAAQEAGERDFLLPAVRERPPAGAMRETRRFPS